MYTFKLSLRNKLCATFIELNVIKLWKMIAFYTCNPPWVAEGNPSSGILCWKNWNTDYNNARRRIRCKELKISHIFTLYLPFILFMVSWPLLSLGFTANLKERRLLSLTLSDDMLSIKWCENVQMLLNVCIVVFFLFFFYPSNFLLPTYSHI